MADHEFSCVADSTDWLATGLKGLAAVEAALRCQVCKDFYNTPMMTTCAHTFCSLCIRRALASDGKCPLCRTSDQESKLRSNHALHEVVDAFTRCRADTMKFAEEPVPQPKLSPTQTLKRSAPEEQNHTPERKRLRRSARRIKPSNEPLTPDFQPDFPLDFDANVEEPSDDEYCEEPDNNLTPCPICGQRMKDWQVFSHLDKCNGDPSPKKPQIERSSTAGGFGFNLGRETSSLERLSPLNYSMLKDQALRKKMSELGLSANGPRALLERRHREWVTIWNANCDAARPKKRRELLQDLELWERTQGGRAPGVLRPAHAATTVRDKDFDGAAWAARHDASFKELIAKARKSRAEAKQITTKAHKEEGGASAAETGSFAAENTTEVAIRVGVPLEEFPVGPLLAETAQDAFGSEDTPPLPAGVIASASVSVSGEPAADGGFFPDALGGGRSG